MCFPNSHMAAFPSVPHDRSPSSVRPPADWSLSHDPLYLRLFRQCNDRPLLAAAIAFLLRHGKITHWPEASGRKTFVLLALRVRVLWFSPSRKLPWPDLFKLDLHVQMNGLLLSISSSAGLSKRNARLALPMRLNRSHEASLIRQASSSSGKARSYWEPCSVWRLREQADLSGLPRQRRDEK